MEYLYKVLGIKATVQRAEFDHLPNYIAVRYRLQKVSMDGQKVIFLYPWIPSVNDTLQLYNWADGQTLSAELSL